jgi:hypothetical protein
MLFAAYRSFNNRSALARARIAGCYACLATFTAEQVVGWTHDDTTAVCPRCGIDAVLPNVDDPLTLRAAQERWYRPASTQQGLGTRSD